MDDFLTGPARCCTCRAYISASSEQLRGFDGDIFCSQECASEYIGFIARELARARQAFRALTPVQRARISDYNTWAGTVSDREESLF